MLNAESKEFLHENIRWMIAFGSFSLLIVWVAWSKGFFKLPSRREDRQISLAFSSVFAVFAIYLGTSILIAPLLAKFFNLLFGYTKTSPPLAMMGGLQLLTMILILSVLFLYCRSQNKALMQKIWKDPTSSTSMGYDFGFGIIAWFVSFPIVTVIGQIADVFVYLIFGPHEYEQLAVRYLKLAIGSTSMLLVALFTILIAAPLIEELLFRGFLQTWFRKHLGTKSAILLSSLCFSIFHLAPSQGVGNISLGISLFAFACFLGFVYERQGCLFASIGLHMAFNTVSACRILFFPES